MSVFQDIAPDKILFQNSHFFIIKDGYPVSPGHLLIISKRPVTDFFELNNIEQQTLSLAIIAAKNIIEQTQQPDGYNIGMNCGAAAGQTVLHFHCHVIPRYIGDMPNPRGGVRHCVAGKGDY